MRKLLPAALVLGFISCNQIYPKDYLNLDYELKPLEKSCKELKPGIHMIGNTAGERYIIEDCLQPGFTKNDIKTERKGDTLILRWRNGGEGARASELILDIDTHPRYNYIDLNGTSSHVIPLE